MATYNPITGDYLISKANTKKYSDNYDQIFNKSKPDELEPLLREALVSIQGALGHTDNSEIKHIKLANDVCALANQLQHTLDQLHADAHGLVKDRVKQGVSPSTSVTEL